MAENKFNTVLQQKVDENRETKAKEDALRKEFGIEEGHTVGIRTYKDSAIISIWKILCNIIRFLATIAILILAAIGLIALLYPESREVLMSIWSETVLQLTEFLPFL